MALGDGLYIPDDAAPAGIGLSNDALRNCMGDFWLLQGTFIDFSVSANRQKFHSLVGAPIDLGVNGELPTGSPPTVFLTGGKTTFGINRGTGGIFSSNGPIEDCLTGLHNILPDPAATRGGITLSGSNYFSGEELFFRPNYPTTGLGSASFWLRLNTLPGSLITIVSAFTISTGIFSITLDSTGHFHFHFGTNDALSSLSFVQTNNPLLADGRYHNILVSWNTQSVSLQLVIDRIVASTTSSGAGGFDVDFGDFTYNVFWQWFGGYTGDAAEFWLLLATQLDVTNSSTQDKFEMGGSTVNLGSDGSLPTGLPPTWYLSQSPQTYGAVNFFRDRAHGSADLYPASGQLDITIAPAPYP